MVKRYYFVNKHSKDGRWDDLVGSPFSYAWCTEDGYCQVHKLDGKDRPARCGYNLNICRYHFKEVTRAKAAALHKRVKRALRNQTR